MKKIYLGLGALAISAGMFAQNQRTVNNNLLHFTKTPAKLNVEPLKGESNTVQAAQERAVTLWSDDFDTPTDWLLGNGTQTSPMGWQIKSGTSSSWAFNAITSTSGGNYAELYNGDPNSDGISPNAPLPVSQTFTLTYGSRIDVDALSGGNNSVSIQFEQYGARFQDLQEVYVSTDSSFWQLVGTNNDLPSTVAGSSNPYANPMVRTYNIASAIASNPDSVWIRFSWSPDVQEITYGWLIDDVKIVTNEDYDNVITSTTFGQGVYQLPYYQIPISQIDDITFSASVFNNGSQDQPGTYLSVNADGAAYDSPTTNLLASTSDSLITVNFTPSATIQTITADYNILADNVDDVPANNMDSKSILITDNIWARDMANANGTGYTGSVDNYIGNEGLTFKAGNVFEITADQTLYGAEAKFVAPIVAGGALVYCQLFKLNVAGDDYDLYETTNEINLTSNAQISGMVKFVFENPVDLFAGEDVLLVVGHYGSDQPIATAGISEGQSALAIGDDGSIGSFSDAENVVVRMSFDAAISVEENEVSGVSLGQNFPNPAKRNTSINYTLENNTDVMIQVTDLSGKVISVINEGAKVAGTYTVNVNTAELSAGTYFYSLTTENGTITKTMNVIK